MSSKNKPRWKSMIDRALLRKNYSKTPISTVWKGMLTLALGSVSARVLGIVSIPILTRIYTPDDYGLLALYVASTALLAPVLSLRLSQAVPLPKNDLFALNLLALSFGLIALNGSLVAMAAFFWGEVVFDFLAMETLLKWWWLVVVGAIGTALYELFSFWATRKRNYKIIASTQVIQSLWGNITKIFSGLAGLQSAGLMVGQLITQTAGVLKFIREFGAYYLEKRPHISLARQMVAGKKYVKFPIFRLPAHVLMVLSMQAPLLMTAALYDTATTGQLSLALMALSLPVTLIGQAMSRAYYGEIASLGASRIEEIREITISVQKKMFMLGVIPAIVVLTSSEYLFGLFFGEKWKLAGFYASVLAPYMLLQFTSVPLMEVVNVIGAQSMFLIIHLLRFIGLAVLYLWCREVEVGSDTFIFLLSIAMTAFYFIVSAFILILVSRNRVRQDVE